MAGGHHRGRAVPAAAPLAAAHRSAAVAALKKLVNARLRRSEEGQDLLEYGLLVALIAVFAIGAVSTVGNTIHTVFWQSIAQNF